MKRELKCSLFAHLDANLIERMFFLIYFKKVLANVIPISIMPPR